MKNSQFYRSDLPIFYSFQYQCFTNFRIRINSSPKILLLLLQCLYSLFSCCTRTSNKTKFIKLLQRAVPSSYLWHLDTATYCTHVYRTMLISSKYLIQLLTKWQHINKWIKPYKVFSPNFSLCVNMREWFRTRVEQYSLKRILKILSQTD